MLAVVMNETAVAAILGRFSIDAEPRGSRENGAKSEVYIRKVERL